MPPRARKALSTDLTTSGVAHFSSRSHMVVAPPATQERSSAVLEFSAALSPRGRELAVVTVNRALRVYALPGMNVLVVRGAVAGVT